MEWVDGIKITDTKSLLAAQFDKKKLMKSIVEAFAEQIFISGIAFVPFLTIFSPLSAALFLLLFTFLPFLLSTFHFLNSRPPGTMGHDNHL